MYFARRRFRDVDPKLNVIGKKKAGICNGVPLTAALAGCYVTEFETYLKVLNCLIFWRFLILPPFLVPNTFVDISYTNKI